MMLYHGKDARVFIGENPSDVARIDMFIDMFDESTPALRQVRDMAALAGLSTQDFARAINNLKLVPTTTGLAPVRVEESAPLPKRAFALDGDLR